MRRIEEKLLYAFCVPNVQSKRKIKTKLWDWGNLKTFTHTHNLNIMIEFITISGMLYFRSLIYLKDLLGEAEDLMNPVFTSKYHLVVGCVCSQAGMGLILNSSVCYPCEKATSSPCVSILIICERWYLPNIVVKEKRQHLELYLAHGKHATNTITIVIIII